MERSTSITNLTAALQTFHKEMGIITPDATNTPYGSSYATLSNILKEIKEPLEKADLVICQFPTGTNILETMLIHSRSGEFIQTAHALDPLDNTPSDCGMAIAYQRRYAITAILSLIIAEETRPASGLSAPPEGVDDIRPWMEENHYQSCVKRINKGNKGVVDAAIKAFQMKPELLQMLRDAEKKSASAKKTEK